MEESIRYNGIPDTCRGQAWMLMSPCYQLKAQKQEGSPEQLYYVLLLFFIYFLLFFVFLFFYLLFFLFILFIIYFFYFYFIFIFIQTLLSKSTTWEKVIEKDIHRTFPNSDFFHRMKENNR